MFLKFITQINRCENKTTKLLVLKNTQLYENKIYKKVPFFQHKFFVLFYKLGIVLEIKSCFFLLQLDHQVFYELRL
jgi:hypothetical protein